MAIFVSSRVGPVAYRLQLPPTARIHPVFHCSVLKPFRGSPDSQEVAPLPSEFTQNQPIISPLAILSYRKSPTSASSWEVLVQWQGLSPDDTTWEDWNQLQKDYHLEDKVILQGSRSDSRSKNTTEAVASTEKNTLSKETIATGVQLGNRTKRAITRPTYLKDFV